jgi:hypothetical protein
MSAVNSDSMRAGASGVTAGYTIDNSIWFDGANDWMTLTFGTPTNAIKWTHSCWLKVSGVAPSNEASYFEANVDGSNTARMWFGTDLKWKWTSYESGGLAAANTDAVYRDPSAWSNFVTVYDSAQGTQANRLKLFKDGVAVSLTQGTAIGASETSLVNTAVNHSIGARSTDDNNEYEGYMAEVVFQDGQASTDATEFGEFDDNGNWVPVSPAGLTFGDNGFWLDFAVAPGTGNGAGTDVSGNANHWTDVSLTTANMTSDSPTDDADNDVGNYCVLNAINNRFGSATLSNGNLDIVGDSSSSGNACPATMAPPSGKFAFEIISTSSLKNWGGGLINEDFDYSDLTEQAANQWSAVHKNGEAAVDNYEDNATGTVWTHGASGGFDFAADSIVIAFDVDAGKGWFGIWDNSADAMIWADNALGTTGDPGAGTNNPWTLDAPSYTPIVWGADESPYLATVNFGATTMRATLPTGFKRLNTANLPAPAIKDPSKYFQADAFTGTGSELVRTLTDAEGGAVKPDLVWIKDRDTVVEYVLTNSVGGATYELNSDSENAETSVAQGLKSFDSSGYTLGTDGNYNTSSSLNVAWCWVGSGGAGSSNTDGSINTSSTSVSTTSGFSVGEYTGTGSAATVGHGLGATPEFYFVKNHDANRGWYTYHASNTAAPETDHLVLDTNAVTYDDATVWNDTAPTSSVVSIGTSSHVNESGKVITLFAFVGIESYSKFGSYEGNYNADGTFVWCGFRPAYILIKNIDANDEWVVFDTARSPYNQTNSVLRPDTSSVEDTGNNMDILSNGFKLRTNSGSTNTANTFVFAAFAEFPFGGDGVSQARAR